MKLRTKLWLAQLPIVIALAVTIVAGSFVTRALGRGSSAILQDNYRSVLAAERMKEAAERVDSGIAFAIMGRAGRGLDQITANLPKFEAELVAQQGNITETGERQATTELVEAWTRYRAAVGELEKSPEASGLADRYFTTLLPEFLAVKDAADRVLAVNQDAMLAKSDRAEHFAGRSNTLLFVVSVIGLVIGLIASAIITTRLLRPLNVLGQTARRLGEGDMAVRARVDRADEIGQLARELNTMADHIQKYRRSSLGELLEAQLAAQATIDSLPDPVVVIGLAGELRHTNQAAAAILKLSTDGSLASAEPAVRAAIDRLRAHVAAGNGAYVPKGLAEALELGSHEGERLLLPRAAPLYADEGNVAGTTIVFQDVTRLHRFEQLQNDLVATVAHELRTPLTSLRMAVHLLAEQVVGELTAKQGDLVFAAREDCDRLQAIVDELLDLSRIEADRMPVQLAPEDPEAIVAAAFETVRSIAGDVELVSEVLPGPPVQVDRERILLVFANLIGNAIKYAHGRVTVRAIPRDGMVRFEVRDQGPGVPAEYRETIFDKYVRLPGTHAQGAGLGLFISREIVRAHGGELGVDDGNPGAVFWFTVKA